MNKQGYVCLGKCRALVTSEQYENGLVACGNDACENKGKPFVKGIKCEKCGLTFGEGQEHLCKK